MDLAGYINDIITVAGEMKNEPASDKKSLNKTISKLEDAKLWAEKVQPGKFTGLPTRPQGINGSIERTCVCPDGAIDNVNCPVHKQ
jgi:hypothetical protein